MSGTQNIRTFVQKRRIFNVRIKRIRKENESTTNIHPAKFSYGTPYHSWFRADRPLPKSDAYGHHIHDEVERERGERVEERTELPWDVVLVAQEHRAIDDDRPTKTDRNGNVYNLKKKTAAVAVTVRKRGIAYLKNKAENRTCYDLPYPRVILLDKFARDDQRERHNAENLKEKIECRMKKHNRKIMQVIAAGCSLAKGSQRTLPLFGGCPRPLSISPPGARRSAT